MTTTLPTVDATPGAAATTPLRVGVVGLGYLGAVHAACMAELGHTVVGLDVDERKVAALSAARAPFFEPGLEDLLARTTARELDGGGRALTFSTQVGALKGCDVGLRLRRDPPARRRARRRHLLRRGRRRGAGRRPGGPRSGRRQVHGAGGHRGAPVRGAGPPGPGPDAGVEPGVPA